MHNSIILQTSERASSKAFNIVVLHVVVVLTYIGLALPYSIYPVIFINSNQSIGLFLYSLIITTYPIGQAVGMATFGHVSDIYGRKKILQLTLCGALFTFVLSGLCITYKTYFILIFVRFFCGLFEGNAVIAMAAITDMQNIFQDKVKWFGRINIAITVGFLVGPLLGSIFANHSLISWFNYSTPFYVGAVLSFITLLMVTLFFSETYFSNNSSNSHITVIGIFKSTAKNIIYYLKQPGISTLIFLYLLITSSVDTLYQFVPVYLVNKWHTPTGVLATSIFLLSAGKILGNSFFLNRLSILVSSEMLSIIFGLGTLILCLIILISVKSIVVFLLFIFLLGITIPLSLINATTVISNYTRKNKQGSVLGVAQSTRLVAGTIMCNIAASSCLMSFKMPFVLSIGLALIPLYVFTKIINKRIGH